MNGHKSVLIFLVKSTNFTIARRTCKVHYNENITIIITYYHIKPVKITFKKNHVINKQWLQRWRWGKTWIFTNKDILLWMDHVLLGYWTTIKDKHARLITPNKIFIAHRTYWHWCQSQLPSVCSFCLFCN